LPIYLTTIWAQFLIEVAREAQKYPSNPDNQWYYLGGHLRNFACSTDEARDMVKQWAYWIDNSKHGLPLEEGKYK